MAKNNIVINRNYRMGADLAGMLETQNNVIARLKVMKSQMDNMTDASDWTVIEAQFGIPTGKGQSVYNLLAGGLSELDADSNFQNLLNWITSA